MLGDQILLDDSPGDQVILDDPLQHRRIAGAIPRAFGIDDRNRSAFTNAQAVRFRAQDAALLRQAELLEPLFQEIPRSETSLLVAALRLRLIAAQEDVPPRDGDTDARRDLA